MRITTGNPPRCSSRCSSTGSPRTATSLLNVGPTARGEFDDRAVSLLREIGNWMRRHSQSIYGCGPSLFMPPPDCRYTAKGERLFLHIFSWPFGHVHLSRLAGKVEFARFVHDGSEVATLEIDPGQKADGVHMGGLPPGTLTLKLPVRKPDVLVPVVELLMREPASASPN